MRHVDFSPLYRSTVGFDRLFTMLDTLAQPDVDRMVASSIAVEPKSGPKRVSIIAYAYDNPQGREMILIILPSTLGKLNPAYQQAFAAMNDFWRDGMVYTPTP